MGKSKIIYHVEEVNGCHFRMVSLPGGIFEMGALRSISVVNATPIHKVEVSPFYMGEYVVTQALWKAVMRGHNPSNFKGDRRPVEGVSWNDIVTGEENVPSFLQEINKVTENSRPTNMVYRLPTEAEWEYAAFSNEQGIYSGSELLKEVGWYNHNSRFETHDVGLKKPNGFGLFDMSGNVWEWCQDSFDLYFFEKMKNNNDSLIKNPLNDTNTDRYVLKGGSYLSIVENCINSYRHDGEDVFRGDYVGFRLVLASSLAELKKSI